MERIAIDLSLLQEIDFWLAFRRENNVVVKLGAVSSRYWRGKYDRH